MDGVQSQSDTALQSSVSSEQFYPQSNDRRYVSDSISGLATAGMGVLRQRMERRTGDVQDSEVSPEFLDDVE